MGELTAYNAEQSSSADNFRRYGSHREGGGFVSSKTLYENKHCHVDEDEQPGCKGRLSSAIILIAYG